MWAFNPHLTFSSRALLNTEYMYGLFSSPFYLPFFSVIVWSRSPRRLQHVLCVWGALRLSRQTQYVSRLSGRSREKRGLSPLYCLTASPLYCFTESRVFSRARQTWRKLQCCQISHKLPDLPRHGNKRKFQQWLFMGFVRVQYSGHRALAVLCLESLPRFLLQCSQCRASLLN